MAKRAFEAYPGQHANTVEFLLKNKEHLTDSARTIIEDIYSRNPNTLSAKQISMITEMKDKVIAILSALKTRARQTA